MTKFCVCRFFIWVEFFQKIIPSNCSIFNKYTLLEITMSLYNLYISDFDVEVPLFGMFTENA